MSDVIFNDGNITVTRTLVQVGSASYPINGIGQVLIAPPERIKPMITGIVVAVVGYLFIDVGIVGPVLLVVGGLAVLGAFASPYRLVFNTASGNQQVLQSRNTSNLLKVKQAVETAVQLRG